MKRFFIPLIIVLGFAGLARSAMLFQRSQPTVVGGQTASGGTGIPLLVDANGKTDVWSGTFVTDFDSGLITVSSTGTDTVIASVNTLWQTGYCNNTAGTATVTISNTAGLGYVTTLSLATNTTFTWNFGPRGIVAAGLKIRSNTVNVLNCQFSGLQ